MSGHIVKWATGAAAALGGFAAAEAVSAIGHGRSLVDSAGDLVVELGPRPLVDAVVQVLRSADKPAIRTVVVGTGVLASGFLARVVGRSVPRDLALSGLVVGAAWVGSRRPPRRLAPSLAAAAAGGLAAGAILRAERSIGRATATAAIGGAALWLARRRLHDRETRLDDAAIDTYVHADPLPEACDGADLWQGAVPLITSTKDFYTVDVNIGTPLIDSKDWRLKISGAVQRPTQWNLPSLTDLGVEEFDAVMVCVHYRHGWHRVGNARWTGVPLSKLLDSAGPMDGANTLVTRSVDGFAISLPLELVRRMDSYVVVGMNGGPLPARHGYPARIFVPGLYGQYAGVKWVTELEITTGPHPDYWGRRGWPREPVAVRPISRIDAPDEGALISGSLKMAGVAWAPPQGISRVEVAVDDGEWLTVEMAAELAPAAWRRWRFITELSAGEHRIRTRAVGRDGTVQDPMPRPPFPSGVSGYHTISVRGGAPR